MAAYAATQPGAKAPTARTRATPFVTSGSAAFVLGPTGGRILRVDAGKGSFDVSDKPLTDLGKRLGRLAGGGTTIFTKGAKQ